MEHVYRIAGMNVAVELLSPEVYDRFMDYTTEGEPDFTISVTPEDIEEEIEIFQRLDKWRECTDPDRTRQTMEFAVVIRKLVEKTPFYQVFCFHGSTVAVDGEAYIFSALPGTGKSTHTALWRDMLGERAVMVNDDKPMLRVTEDQTLACGSPWRGKHRIGGNLQVPVKAICFLERSETNWIREISKKEAYPEIIRQIFRPEDPLAMMKVMELVGKMKVRYYALGCNMDPEAARVAYQGMK